ncbi:hypothetical protein F2P81_008551 [Scophthalmus maximus]|uniref:Neuferricin n=1 Tax=Scophthalmus maximus TaxID=52904 RepID=A0A6A4SWY7_SCOMX|nr:hypothetical protein F2P81_008551 [Scophthalmus maximus]
MLSYVLALLAASLAVLVVPRYWSVTFGNESTQGAPVRLLSSRELSLYDGEDGSRGLYLALMGQVVALYDWLAFYQRDYQAVGLVIGRFYGETGQPTEALLQVEASLVEGQRIKAQSEAEKVRFPACNSEWSSARGGRVWCSTKSGGVMRDWTGVPRKLFSPGSTGVRCVCVEDPSAAEEDPNLQKYEGCPPHADSCSVAEF